MRIPEILKQKIDLGEAYGFTFGGARAPGGSGVAGGGVKQLVAAGSAARYKIITKASGDASGLLLYEISVFSAGPFGFRVGATSDDVTGMTFDSSLITPIQRASSGGVTKPDCHFQNPYGFNDDGQGEAAGGAWLTLDLREHPLIVTRTAVAGMGTGIRIHTNNRDSVDRDIYVQALGIAWEEVPA